MSITNLENVYNEVTHSNTSLGDVNGLDPMYHFDTHYPERFSINNTEFPSPVARRSRKGRNRNSARFKTQPITFDEIKEVDEENPDDSKKKLKSKEGLKNQFTAFSRSMDGLVPSCLMRSKIPDIKPLSSDYNENEITCRPLSQRPQESRLSPEVNKTGQEDDAKSSEDGAAKDSTLGIQLPQLVDSSRNRRLKRFKKKQRHSRSIEEEAPILERNDADETVR